MASIPSVSEEQFRRRVRDYARYMGWGLQYHTGDSRRSDPGWPDEVFARSPRVVFIEFKSEHGRLRDTQREWLTALVQGGLEVAVWRPSDWPEIREVLGRPGRCLMPPERF